MKRVVCFLFATMTLIAGQALAGASTVNAPSPDAIPTGYFTGKAATSKGQLAVRVWIKTVAKSAKSSTTYGLIMMKESRQASLFKVERLPDGTMTWTELFESDKHVLAQATGGNATYMGESFRINSSHNRLTLIPTDYGHNLGCVFNLEVESDSGIDWVDFPSTPKRFEGANASQFDVSGSLVSGSVIFSDSPTASGRLTGNYRLTQIFPGLATLRAKIVSPDSNDGRAEERKITAMVVMLKRHRFILSNKDTLVLIRLNSLDKQNICWSADAYLEN